MENIFLKVFLGLKKFHKRFLRYFTHSRIILEFSIGFSFTNGFYVFCDRDALCYRVLHETLTWSFGSVNVSVSGV